MKQELPQIHFIILEASPICRINEVHLDLAKAKELTFRAMRVKGLEAERIGLVNRAFKAEEFDSEIDHIVTDIQENSFAAIKAIKRLYNEGYNTTLREGLLLELAADTYLPDTDV